MVGWRVLLWPPSPLTRARPRWLRADGGFSLDPARALLVVDDAVAAERIQGWLIGKQRPLGYLQRMQLVHSCSNPAAEQRWPEHKPVGLV